MRTCSWILSLAILLSAALAAPAALVTFHPYKTSDTTFEIRASVTSGDNYGIASFQIRLSDGTYTGITNYSPRVLFFQDGDDYSPWAGFSTLRSAGNVNPINGSQDTLNPAGAIMVYGIGQTAGNLHDINPGGYDEISAVQMAYDADVILVKGTTAPGAAAPTLVNNNQVMVPGMTYSIQNGTFVNVFTTNGGVTTTGASVAVSDAPAPTPTPTPTPGGPTPTPGGPTPTPGGPTPTDGPTPTPTIPDPGPCCSTGGVSLIVVAALLLGLLALGGPRFGRFE